MIRINPIRGFVLAVAVLALGGAGTALADPNDVQVATGGPNPFTDRTRASFELDAERQTVQSCSGQDGVYAEIRTHYEGTSSGDPRLTGVIEVDTVALVRQNSNPGPFLPDFGQAGLAEAKFSVFSADGTKRADGRSFVTIGGTDTAATSLTIEGVAFGNVKARGDLPGGELIGNLNATATPPTGTRVSGEFGTPGGVPVDEVPDNDEQPAFIQDGQCTGPSTTTVP